MFTAVTRNPFNGECRARLFLSTHNPWRPGVANVRAEWTQLQNARCPEDDDIIVETTCHSVCLGMVIPNYNYGAQNTDSVSPVWPRQDCLEALQSVFPIYLSTALHVLIVHYAICGQIHLSTIRKYFEMKAGETTSRNPGRLDAKRLELVDEDTSKCPRIWMVFEAA